MPKALDRAAEGFRKVRDELVADEFNRHGVPAIGIEPVSALAMPAGKIRSGLVQRGLDDALAAFRGRDAVVVRDGGAAEGLFEPDRHFRRNPAVAVDQAQVPARHVEPATRACMVSQEPS